MRVLIKKITSRLWIVSWNIRRFGRAAKILILKEVIKCHKADVVLLR